MAVPARGPAPRRARARAGCTVRARLRPGPSGCVDVVRPGRRHRARSRGGRRGARNAAPAGGGMTIDEDLEEAAAARTAPGEVHPGLRRARAWLSRATEPGTVDFWRYVDEVGPVDAVRRLRSGT